MKTILIAEDSEDDVFLLQRALDRTGVKANVRVVSDGEQALAYLRGQDEYSDRERFPFPALTLLDIKMPRKNGLEVLQEVRGDARLSRLLVVIFTSSGEPRDINQAFDLHANSYLVKTGDMHFLARLCEKMEEYWLYLNLAPICPLDLMAADSVAAPI